MVAAARSSGPCALEKPGTRLPSSSAPASVSRKAAPGGMVKIEPQNLHTWLTPRIAQWQPDGQDKIVDAYKAPVMPLPYVAYGETDSAPFCTGKGLDTAKLKG